jgi:undecaprenyl diphosphate synthase
MTYCRHQENHRAKMDQSIAGLQEQPDQDPHRPRQPRAAGCHAVEYYGSMTPMSQVANVSLLDARTISVQPWEKGMGAKIEKAIRESDLGLNPASMGDLIRVPMPPMSEERRKEMTKIVRTEGENAKIAVRNLRRDANEPSRSWSRTSSRPRTTRSAPRPTSRRSPTAISPRSTSWWRPRSRKSWRSEAGRSALTAPMHLPLRTRGSHHVAIVMDGNGRWATRRFLPRVAGHKRGVDALRALRAPLRERGVRVLTVFAFSSENWNRPPRRVSGLMELLAWRLSREVPQLRPKVCACAFVGDRSALSDKVRAGLAQAEAAIGQHPADLNVCFNYGGRWDIAQAAAGLAQRGEAITEPAWTRTGAGPRARPGLADPHRRRAAHQQLPAVAGGLFRAVFHGQACGPNSMSRAGPAIADFGQRERRFGKTPDQLNGRSAAQRAA